MEIDQNVRQELMHKLAAAGGPGIRLRFRTKVVFWETTVKLTYLLKRIFDFGAATILMLLLSPVFLVTGLAVYLTDPGPIFYAQIRVGKNGRHFRFFKFRSMVVNADKIKEELADQNESSDGVLFKMKDDPRITRVGKIIRKFSVDELPQLVNVIKGDMSLVGPRPALPDEVASYTLEQRKRLHILPGITGIWQVSGRSDIPFTGQVRLDLDYISSQSLWRDIVILLKTIPAVLGGHGAY